jgi:ribose transport system substrate-binding protein
VDHATPSSVDPAPAAPARHEHHERQRQFSPLSVLIIAVLCGLLLWTSGVLRGKPEVVIVTSGEGPYWDPVIKGAEEAATESNVKLKVMRCKSNREVQFKAIQDALNTNPAGIAVSPLDPAFQNTVLAQVAANTTLVTFDSDSPVSRRLCFVGTDNYGAGRLLGEAVKQAVPDGGEVIICMGVPNKDNTLRRRQGVIDELLGRPVDALHAADPFDKPLQGEKYTISATLLDDGDRDKAHALATDALKSHPNTKCYIGLVSYSAPTVVEVMKQAGGSNTAKVLGFDVDERTLKGIEDGSIQATVMQDQYGLGYHAVRILAAEALGNRGELPAYQEHVLPCRIITKENVQQARGAVPDNVGPAYAAPTSGPTSKPAEGQQSTAAVQ